MTDLNELLERVEWLPSYPGQPTPIWRWWNRADPELGLLGFLTKADRDFFSKGKPGPYRRIVAPDGLTILQNEDFRGMGRSLAHDAGIQS